MKRKLPTIGRIAAGNIKNRRRQYALLVSGVLLAVFFSSAAVLMIGSVYASSMENHYDRYGAYDAAMHDVERMPVQTLLDEGVFKELGHIEQIAEAMDGDAVNPLFSLAKADETAIELTRLWPVEGRLPEKAGEIAIETRALGMLRQGLEIGSKIKLTLRIPDGEGYLQQTVEKEYVLTGILKARNFPSWRNRDFDTIYNDLPGAIVSDEEPLEPGGRSVLTACGTYSMSRRNAYNRLEQFYKENGRISDQWYVEGLDVTPDLFNDIDLDFAMPIIIWGLVSIMLMLSSCSGIASSFTSVIDARKRQVGLLRAVGMTVKQLRSVLLRETLYLMAAVLPIGVGLAYLTVWRLIAILGEGYVFAPNFIVLAGMAIISVLSVLLSTNLPLKRVGKIPPMQAIRDTDSTRKIGRSMFKSKKTFSPTRLVAQRMAMLQKGRLVVISITLTLGITAFTLIARLFLPDAVDRLSNNEYDYHYELYQLGSYGSGFITYQYRAPGITEKDRADMENLPTAHRVTGKRCVHNALLTPEEITSYATANGMEFQFHYLLKEKPEYLRDETGDHGDYFAREHDNYLKLKQQYGFERDFLTVEIIALDDDALLSLNQYAEQGDVDLNALASGDEILIFAPEYTAYEYSDGSSVSFGPEVELSDYEENAVHTYHGVNDMFMEGGKLDLSLLYTLEAHDYEKPAENVVRLDHTARIGAVIGAGNSVGSQFNILSVITSHQGLKSMGIEANYEKLELTLSEEPDPQTEAYINDAIKQMTYRANDLYSYSNIESARELKSTIINYMLFFASVVLLLFFSTAIMVSNALAARIRAGRQGIGTLRAVGASEKEIGRIYLRQLAAMFGWGGVAGYAASLFLAPMMEESMLKTEVYLPVAEPLLFFLALFLFCCFVMRRRLKKVLKESIVENIRVL